MAFNLRLAVSVFLRRPAYQEAITTAGKHPRWCRGEEADNKRDFDLCHDSILALGDDSKPSKFRGNCVSVSHLADNIHDLE